MLKDVELECPFLQVCYVFLVTTYLPPRLFQFCFNAHFSVSTAPKEFNQPSKLSKGQKKRLKKQQKKQQLLLEQELDELEEIECREQEQRLREMGMLPEGDIAANVTSDEQHQQDKNTESTSTHVLPSGLLPIFDASSFAHIIPLICISALSIEVCATFNPSFLCY